MAETPSGIPDRPWFKPSEVCEVAGIQPYVLRSWESEFPNLGSTPAGSAGRVYSRSDVEQVLKIKRFVFEEGLTVAGVRRRMEGEPPPAPSEPPLETYVGEDARVRLAAVRQGLRSLLAMLSGDGADGAARTTGVPGVTGTGGVAVVDGQEAGAPADEAPQPAEAELPPKGVADEDFSLAPWPRRGAVVPPPEPVEGRRRRGGRGIRRPGPDAPPSV